MVQYWDASALVSLCLDEDDTKTLRRLVRAGLITWSVSAVEIASAIERRRREGNLTPGEHAAARAALSDLSAAWTEISALAAVRDRAMRLVATHALRAADAMQLGAALVAVGDRPGGHAFVCADHRLRDAGLREGFHVLPGAEVLRMGATD
jgi:predicted nucleic acid-binding protein